MRTEFERFRDRAHAVLVQSRGFLGTARQIVVRVLAGIDRAAFEKVDRFAQDIACRRWWQHSARSPAAARADRRSSACGRRGPKADATSAERRLRRTAGSRTAAGAREGAAAPCGRAPWRPATDRGTRKRRRTGSSRCGPTAGTPESGTRASRSPARSTPDRAWRPARRRAFAASSSVTSSSALRAAAAPGKRCSSVFASASVARPLRPQRPA